jgi:hypothetical protein
MVNRTEIMSNKVTVEITDAGMIVDNFKTITFREGDNYNYIEISDENYNELGQKMFPDGLIPDDFHKKIAMLNQLIEELEDIQDVENPDWELRNIWYDQEKDTIFFDCKEVGL